MSSEKWEVKNGVSAEKLLSKTGDELPTVCTSVKCPNCSEPVEKTATLCSHCKHAIFSHSKGANAMAAMFLSIIVFFGLFYALSSFTQCEGQRQYQNILKQLK